MPTWRSASRHNARSLNEELVGIGTRLLSDILAEDGECVTNAEESAEDDVALGIYSHESRAGGERGLLAATMEALRTWTWRPFSMLEGGVDCSAGTEYASMSSCSVDSVTIGIHDIGS